MSTRPDQVLLDGSSLTVGQLALVAAGASVRAAPGVMQRVRGGFDLAERLAESQSIYGRSTGVGAAKTQTAGETSAHGMQLLRSHAAGWGEPFPSAVIRAALVIRANQLLQGRSGATPELVGALVELAQADELNLPIVHRHGSLGTGDLTALAEVGLALAGERPRVSGEATATLKLTAADALPLMSSSAFTLAEAALATVELQHLAEAAMTVSALSWVALRGSGEAVSREAESASPFPGAQRVMQTMRALLDGQDYEPANLQDFFGLRAWPQVHGPMLDALDSVAAVVDRAANTASENPLFTDGDHGGSVTHHGGFHTAYLALAIDSALLALTGSGQSVQSRLGHLLAGDAGLPLFLGAGGGASGLLIGEYAAASALAQIRSTASSPSTVLTTSVSAGVEDDAGFASIGAGRLAEAVTAYRQLLSVELVAAVRAGEMLKWRPTGPLVEALAVCATLGRGHDDRDLAPDFETAGQLLDTIAAAAAGRGGR